MDFKRYELLMMGYEFFLNNRNPTIFSQLITYNLRKALYKLEQTP